ncbi:DUF6993 domain-containing protein [Zhihengliuella sp. ISTPL4]|uniref:DUF6993 domain-containing protein n=1 Tax=Zhihengliuella sp. ISTPL4 TaxID=2058657 RepID=UPI002570EECA|nr:hypothetical protein [Zhihengliuella sp. ISTPL4]
MLRSVFSSRAAALALVAGAAVALLAACAPTPETAPTPTPSASAESTAPAAPVLVPGGDAGDNLPVFTAVAEQVWGTEQRGEGRAYIDALVAAGFDRAAMQLTPDQSTVGNPAESIQFSVRWGEEECLIGQVGPSTGAVVTTVMPQLAGGRCLVGATRPIDW